MKNNYQFNIVLFAVLFLGMVGLSSSSEILPLKAINYSLYHGEETVERLLNELETQLSNNESLNNDNFYVTFSECNKAQEITLNYCDKCDLRNLIDASNRFLVLDRRTSLPVVFEGDKIHSNYIKEDLKNSSAPILYNIENGGDIIAELLKAKEEYKALVPKLKLEDTDFYVAYNECSDQRIAILGYCKGCAFKELIASTNRYFVIDEDLQLPIIFESDRQHSNFFSSPDGIRIFITAEGYMVISDKENNIVSKGFTQY
jgi:hypothetical protein